MIILIYQIFFCGLPLAIEQIDIDRNEHIGEDKRAALEWISSDKLHHFAYSFGLTGLAYHVYHCKLNNPNPGARYFSISLASAVAIAKEVYDKLSKKGRLSYKDLCASALGIAVGTILFTR